MSYIICTARNCPWNDSEADECTKPAIRVVPSIDTAEPAFCDCYVDADEGDDDE